MTRLQLPQDENAAFAYLFCMGVQKEFANFAKVIWQTLTSVQNNILSIAQLVV